MNSIRNTLLLLIPALTLGACSQPAAGGQTITQDSAGIRAWPHESSDIQLDDRIHFGNFDNGLRFAWVSNPEPNDRCYLRLHVNVGSLAETGPEQGMAHFLEHMAFNGSENFEAGTLIEWFQDHGMNFGADTNAHTSFSETVYKLDLPHSDEKTLREGLTVMKDFAFGLLLEEKEVEAEKGVIDGEERERDSAQYRMFLEQIDQMFAGTRYKDRIPIGLKRTRDAFSAKSVRAFYEKWYRPDNMTLVLVGDLGDRNPESLFADYFKNVTCPAIPLPEEPDTGKPENYSFSFSIHEEEIPTVSVSYGVMSEWNEKPLTIAQSVSELPLEYAYSMLNTRFAELVKKEGTPFMSASASQSEVFDIFEDNSLNITSAPEKWSAAFGVAEQELRRALKFGFQDAELDEIRAGALRGLDEAVERESTAHSRSILNSILSAAENEFVPTRAKWRKDIYRPAIEALTVGDCHEALKATWDREDYSITTAGNLDLGEKAKDQLRTALLNSKQVEVNAGAEISVSQFAYASSRENSGGIISSEEVGDLDFEHIRFENGVSVNIKKTDFKENQILILLNSGEGRLSLEIEKNALAWVGERVFNSGGLGAHSDDDLRRLLAGKQVGVSFAMGEDRFSLSGSTTMEDLGLQFELMCAYLSDPGWREDGLVQLRRAVPQIFESLKHQHGGPLALKFLPALFDNDPRFGLPTQDGILEVAMEEIRDWLAPILADGAMEVTVVGDLDMEETKALVAQTFGALNPRKELKHWKERRNVPETATGLRKDYTIQTQVPKSLVFIIYPASDGMDASRRRGMSMLGTVLDDRLRLEIRERLGAAYSPGAGSEFSSVYENNGFFYIQAMADPDKVETLVEACLATADTLAQKGATDEEVKRLAEPEMNGLRDAMRTNAYWLDGLSKSLRRPSALDDMRSIQAWFENLSADQVNPWAYKFLSRNHANVCVVNPE